MKNNKRFIIFAVVVILIVSSIVYSYPRRLSREYEGIMYRLGDSKYCEYIKWI